MNKSGVLHKLMLFLILVVGFGVALVWPQVQKQIDIHYARQAAQTGRQLAKAEQAFYAKNGFYTADFEQLQMTLPCPVAVKDNRSLLHCPHYDFVLEEASVLRVSNTKYPKWFEVSLEDGSIVCRHEEESLVGARICSKVNL